MKTILFIHAGAELYGADRNILRAILALSGGGYRCVLLVPNDGPLLEKARKEGVTCIVTGFPILRRGAMNLSGLFSYIVSYIRALPKIKKVIKEYRVDIIHSNTLVVCLGAFFYRSPGLTHIWHIRETIWKPWLLKKVLYGVVKLRADCILCVSKAVSDAMGPNARAVILHNGIEPVTSAPDLERHRAHKKQYTVGTLGRFNAIKGQIHLAQAAEYLRDVHKRTDVRYLFAGGVFRNDTSWLDRFNEYIVLKKLTDVMTVSEFTTEVAPFYTSLDLFVLPSTSPDSFPTVVLEAISAGVPVVGYRNGGIVEILENDEECLAELGNYKMLGDRILRMISDNEFRYSKAKKQYEQFQKHYSIDVFKKNITALYESITA